MLRKLSNVSVFDLLGIFYFLILLPPSIIVRLYLRIFQKEVWLICETKKTARDNGFVFFEYVYNNHKEINAYYAIDKKCGDYQKLKKYKKVVQWGSLKHYFLYMISTKNISSHKEGNPNHLLFTILHLYLNLYNNRVFLQHGVLYTNMEMFHKKNTKFKIFICGAKPEYDFVCEKYGYTNEVKYTGLARFDRLENVILDKKYILYMPTWRRWFTSKEELIESNYYKKINELINSKELDELLLKNNIEFIFCPHTSFEASNKLYSSNCNNVKIINNNEADIQMLLRECSLLITDFSSVHTDVAFLNKPIIYYQYDEKDYYEKHIGKSCYDTYFDFREDGFGEVCSNIKELNSILKHYLENEFVISKKYSEKINNFFELHDKKNCERIFNVIKNTR